MRKLDAITMDFVTKLPLTSRGHVSIWFVVNRLTEYARLIPINEKFLVNRLANVYIKEVVKFHSVPISIMSN